LNLELCITEKKLNCKPQMVLNPPSARRVPVKVFSLEADKYMTTQVSKNLSKKKYVIILAKINYWEGDNANSEMVPLRGLLLL